MSIMESMNIGSRALKAHGYRLDVHSKNMANIDTPNYVRRIPVLNATEEISFHGLMNEMKEDVFGVGTLPMLQGGVVFNGTVEDPTLGEKYTNLATLMPMKMAISVPLTLIRWWKWPTQFLHSAHMKQTLL